MLYSSSLLAIVGAGEQPSLSPRRLCLFNSTTGTSLRELNFLTSILAVRLNKKRLVVVLQEKTFIYDSNSLAILDTIDTIPNPKVNSTLFMIMNLQGFVHSPLVWMVAFWHFLQVRVKDRFCCTMSWKSIYTARLWLIMIDAHRAPLAAMSLSSSGTYVATASEQGTIIRVHHVLDATKSYSFRRGTYPSTIYSLSFGPSSQLPDILVATSSSGSVHAFPLSMAVNQRGKRSTSFLGSILPDSVNDALDPAYHHVLHRAVPAGVRSYVVVRKVEKAAEAPATHVAIGLRATLAVINYNGYFQEYILDFNGPSDPKWSLEREFNLLAARSGNEQHFQMV
ncbi:unnamed protein product [Linum tenue]|uniref:Uncharacterized protein n=1 Tax=Linum tenue TaxID=586396 RepID=A0AAV0L0F0_9ROSI|nr:unnamed protein product [Linum tenue]